MAGGIPLPTRAHWAFCWRASCAAASINMSSMAVLYKSKLVMCTAAQNRIKCLRRQDKPAPGSHHYEDTHMSTVGTRKPAFPGMAGPAPSYSSRSIGRGGESSSLSAPPESSGLLSLEGFEGPTLRFSNLSLSGGAGACA